MKSKTRCWKRAKHARGEGKDCRLTALIIRKANLSVDLLVEVDKKDFGWIEGNLAQHFHQTLFCRSLRQVFQRELIAFTRSARRRRSLTFRLCRGLSALSASANLFLLLLH